MVEQHCGAMTVAGLSQRTIDERRFLLRRLEADAGDLATMTGPRLSAWLGGRPLSAQSRSTYRTHLQGFFRWALEQGLIDADPTAKLPRIRVPKGTPRPIAEADLERAIKRARGDMRTWLLLGSLQGLRAMEIAGIRGEDIDHDNALVYVRGKGGKTAAIPAHPAVLALAGSYPARGYWFPSRMHPGEPVRPRWVTVQVSAFFKSIGVDATCHQLRHLAATRWLRTSGGDFGVTRVLMRHESVATTERYAQVVNDRGAAVVCAQPVPLDAA